MPLDAAALGHLHVSVPCARRPRRRVGRGPAPVPAARDAGAPPPPPRPPPPPPAGGEVGWLWQRGLGAGAAARRTLAERGHRPKKGLGQNFLLDDAVLAAVVRAACVAPGDSVLEVGPGAGSLTRHLLAAGARVTAIEKDDGLYEALQQAFFHAPAGGGGGGGGGGEPAEAARRLRLRHGDALRLDPAALLDSMEAWAAEDGGGGGGGEGAGGAGGGAPPPAVRVVANLPYNITKDFLRAWLPRGGRVASLALMLQEEAAERLTAAAPGGRAWRAANVVARYFSAPRLLLRVDRRRYSPPPGVNGAVVEFALRPPGERARVPDEAAFLALVRRAFLGRRKALRNALAPAVAPAAAAAALAAAGLPRDARAQDLDVEQFAALARALHAAGEAAGGGLAPGGGGSYDDLGAEED